MHITEISKNEMGIFNKSSSVEKMLLVCKEGCDPCDKMFSAFQDIQHENEVKDLNLFKIKLLNDDDGVKDFTKAINVKFFPTLFYFKAGECVARKQGGFSGNKPEKN